MNRMIKKRKASRNSSGTSSLYGRAIDRALAKRRRLSYDEEEIGDCIVVDTGSLNNGVVNYDKGKVDDDEFGEPKQVKGLTKTKQPQDSAQELFFQADNDPRVEITGVQNAEIVTPIWKGEDPRAEDEDSAIKNIEEINCILEDSDTKLVPPTEVMEFSATLEEDSTATCTNEENPVEMPNIGQIKSTWIGAETRILTVNDRSSSDIARMDKFRAVRTSKSDESAFIATHSELNPGPHANTGISECDESPMPSELAKIASSLGLEAKTCKSPYENGSTLQADHGKSDSGSNNIQTAKQPMRVLSSPSTHNEEPQAELVSKSILSSTPGIDISSSPTNSVNLEQPSPMKTSPTISHYTQTNNSRLFHNSSIRPSMPVINEQVPQSPTRFRTLIPISREDRPREPSPPLSATSTPTKIGKVHRSVVGRGGHHASSKPDISEHPISARKFKARSAQGTVKRIKLHKPTNNSQQDPMPKSKDLSTLRSNIQYLSIPNVPQKDLQLAMPASQFKDTTSCYQQQASPITPTYHEPLYNCDPALRQDDDHGVSQQTPPKEAHSNHSELQHHQTALRHTGTLMNVVTEDIETGRTPNGKMRLRNRAADVISGWGDVELEEDETTGGQRRAYPEVYGCIVDKNSASGIVAITARGISVQQVDTGQGTAVEPYEDMKIGVGQACMIYGNSTVLYYRPRKNSTSVSKPVSPPRAFVPPPIMLEKPNIPKIVTHPPSPTPLEITIRLQKDEEGHFTDPYPFSIWHPGMRTTEFFNWFSTQTNYYNFDSLTFTLKDSMPERKSRSITLKDEDDFKWMKKFAIKQSEKASGFLPGLKEFGVLVTDPGWSSVKKAGRC